MICRETSLDWGSFIVHVESQLVMQSYSPVILRGLDEH